MPGCAVQCKVVFVVLRVLDIVGNILWLIVSGYYERLSVESRVLDRGAPLRRRYCCCCRVIAASAYYTEEASCTWDGGLERMAGALCALLLRSCGCSCCIPRQSCAVCCTMCHTTKMNAQKSLLPDNSICTWWEKCPCAYFGKKTYIMLAITYIVFGIV